MHWCSGPLSAAPVPYPLLLWLPAGRTTRCIMRAWTMGHRAGLLRLPRADTAAGRPHQATTTTLQLGCLATAGQWPAWASADGLQSGKGGGGLQVASRLQGRPAMAALQPAASWAAGCSAAASRAGYGRLSDHGLRGHGGACLVSIVGGRCQPEENGCGCCCCP
jgi:hypothetical protein